MQNSRKKILVSGLSALRKVSFISSCGLVDGHCQAKPGQTRSLTTAAGWSQGFPRTCPNPKMTLIARVLELGILILIMMVFILNRSFQKQIPIRALYKGCDPGHDHVTFGTASLHISRLLNHCRCPDFFALEEFKTLPALE